MKAALISMFSSKKFIVFLSTVVTAIVVAVTGLGDAEAANLVDKIINLAMAYMGGQGLADAGKYFGAAMHKDDAEKVENVFDAPLESMGPTPDYSAEEGGEG